MKYARTTLATLAIALSLAMLAASTACGGDSAITRTGTSATPGTPTAATSPLSPPPIDATPLVEVTGLFTDPRETRVDEHRSLGPKPANFAPWEGTSTMRYDTVDGTETNLGLGSLGRFSPDGTRMVWIANDRPVFNNGEVMLIDIATMQKRSLGPGRAAAFTDDDHVSVTKANGNDSESVDLRTGAHSAEARPSLRPNFPDVTTPDGDVLRRELRSDAPFLRSNWYLTDKTGALLLRFEAYLAMPAGPGALAVETVPELSGALNYQGRRGGSVNIFLIDIPSGHATFLGTSGGGTESFWAFAADERYVVWERGYCAGLQGHTDLFDRRTGTITQFDAAPNARFTPGGLLAVGIFHGVELIDPETTTVPRRDSVSGRQLLVA